MMPRQRLAAQWEFGEIVAGRWRARGWSAAKARRQHLQIHPHWLAENGCCISLRPGRKWRERWPA